MGLIVLGYDGSPPSRRALAHASRRAMEAGDELVLLTIIPSQVRGSSLQAMMPAGLDLPGPLNGTFEVTALSRLDELAEGLRKEGAKVRTMVRAGDTATEFLAAVKELNATEIVIGHKAFEGPHLTLGANADLILRGSSVPVTVVP